MERYVFDAKDSKTTIAVCQLESDVGTADYDPRPANVDRALKAIESAADQGARLVMLGEAYLNGYGTNEHSWEYAISESIEDPSVRPLAELAAARDLVLIVGATTYKGPFPGEIYNSALVLGPDGLIGVYSKTHVASHVVGGRVIVEKVYWSPGLEIPVFDTPLGRIGVEICYDVWFPEVARTLTLKGAELIVNVSAAMGDTTAVLGGKFGERWSRFLFVRAWENAVPYVHANVVGTHGDFEFAGCSKILTASGDIVAEAPPLEEAILVASWDRAQTLRARASLHPFYNRNPALYEIN
jgi:predicted amidohydrolase